MENIRAFLIVVVLAATSRGASAQQLSQAPEAGGDLPPALGMLDEPGALADQPPWQSDQPLEAIPAPEADRRDQGFEGSILGEPMEMLGACPPAYFESSGTWLERGFWYTEVDYLLLNRGWDRKGLQLAFEATQGTVPLSTPNGGTTNAPVVGVNELRLQGHRPGAEGVGRVKLGRFLFRDSTNRDHMVEIGWYGGGNWRQTNTLEAATAAGLDIVDYIDRVNISFDGARSLGFDYSSEMNSGEANYIVKSRMHRDQMALKPDGRWVRRANTSRTYSYLAGIRYLNLNEALSLTAEGVDVDPTAAVLREGGDYFIQTSNDLLGTQVGLGFSHDTARWSLGISGKIGSYWNRIDLNSRFQVGETSIVNSGVSNAEQDDLAFIGEFQVLGKWHLRPNLSLRAGLECLFVDSLALAPYQLNFIPGGFDSIAASGDSVFLGTSLGVESYW